MEFDEIRMDSPFEGLRAGNHHDVAARGGAALTQSVLHGSDILFLALSQGVKDGIDAPPQG